MTSAPERRVLEGEAAQWFARLNNKRVSPADLEAFDRWRAEAACRDAYERMEGIWSQSAALAADPDIQRALATTRRNASRAPLQLGWRPSWTLAGLSAALACACIAALLSIQPQTYSTDIGEQRTVSLEDGSRLVLDTASVVKVRYSRTARALVLVEGQARFDVAHEDGRPFEVRARDMLVVATGTRFDVRKDASKVQVTLLQGEVELSQGDRNKDRPRTLRSGQRFAVGSNAALSEVTPRAVDVATAGGWAEGRVMFQDTPLVQAVAEVNRYSRAPIRLASTVNRDTPVSGAFDTSNVAAFAKAIAALLNLELSTQADGTLLVG